MKHTVMCTNGRIIKRVHAAMDAVPGVRKHATEKQAINEALTEWALRRENLAAYGNEYHEMRVHFDDEHYLHGCDCSLCKMFRYIIDNGKRQDRSR